MPVTAIFFHEDQHFRGSMLWSIGAILLVVGIAILAGMAVKEPVGAAVALVSLGAVFLLFALTRLETEVRGDAVYVHLHGLWPTRRIRLDDIASFEARRYTMWDSGGWGVHLGLAGMTYNVSGNEGVHFRLKNGSGVLVGTQRPQEFATAVATALEARGTH